jgi:hypothetical protein
MGAFSKYGAEEKPIAESSPTVWECTSPMGFTYRQAQGKNDFHKACWLSELMNCDG